MPPPSYTKGDPALPAGFRARGWHELLSGRTVAWCSLHSFRTWREHGWPRPAGKTPVGGGGTGQRKVSGKMRSPDPSPAEGLPPPPTPPSLWPQPLGSHKDPIDIWRDGKLALNVQPQPSDWWPPGTPCPASRPDKAPIRGLGQPKGMEPTGQWHGAAEQSPPC